MSKKINMGDTVICIHPASSYYELNKQYEVVPHPEDQSKSLIARDGLYDHLSLVMSNFKKVE